MESFESLDFRRAEFPFGLSEVEKYAMIISSLEALIDTELRSIEDGESRVEQQEWLMNRIGVNTHPRIAKRARDRLAELNFELAVTRDRLRLLGRR